MASEFPNTPDQEVAEIPPVPLDKEDSASAGVADADEHLSLRDSITALWSSSMGYRLVNWVNFGDGVAYFGVMAVMVLFMEKNVGLSANAATSAYGYFSGLVTLSMALGAGALCDRLGVRRALTLAMAIILVGRVMLVTSPDGGGQWMVTGLLWGSILVMGFGEGVLQPALYAGVKEYYDPKKATIGFALLYSVMNLGSIVGHAVSPPVREWYARTFEGVDVETVPTAGLAGSLWFFTLFTAVVLAVNWIFFSRKVEQRDRIVLPAEDEEKPAAGPTGIMAKLRALPIYDARFVFFIFILFPVRTMFAHQWMTMPLYVVRSYDAAVGAKVEWVSGLNSVIIVIGVPLIAILTRKRSVMDMMIVGTLISAASTFMLVPTENLTVLLAYVVVFSIGEAVWSSRFLEYIAAIAPPNRVGIYMGIAGVPWFMAKFGTGQFAGAMVDAFIPVDGAQNPGTLWLIYGAFAMISPVGLLVARRWLLAGEERFRERARQAS